MGQKIIWTTVLAIGLISIIMLLLSCKKEQPPELIRADFIYQNSTSTKIIIDSYSNNKDYSYELNVGENLKITENHYPNYNDRLFIFCDSVRVVNSFGNEIVWYPEMISNRNPIKLENYKYVEVSGRHHEYSFEIVDNDFNNAN